MGGGAGGGAVWRGVARLVGAAPPSTATSHAARCSICTTAHGRRSPVSSARVSSCSCDPTSTYHPANQVNLGRGQFWDLEDWEFAGDEEKDHLVFGSLPSHNEVEEAASDLQDALRLGILAAPSPSQDDELLSASPTSTDIKDIFSVNNAEDEAASDKAGGSSESDWIEPPPFQVVASPEGKLGAPRSEMLEAFHQFQHNPQVQGMVISLATDKGVWDAVLANKKIQEFKRSFQETDADSMEDGDTTTGAQSQKGPNVFSHFFWHTKRAFSQFMDTLRDIMSGVFAAADKKVFADEKDNFLDRTVKSCMMLAVVILAIVVFKRVAVVRRA